MCTGDRSTEHEPGHPGPPRADETQQPGGDQQISRVTWLVMSEGDRSTTTKTATAPTRPTTYKTARITDTSWTTRQENDRPVVPRCYTPPCAGKYGAVRDYRTSPTTDHGTCSTTVAPTKITHRPG
jgi:hypothetical protein